MAAFPPALGVQRLLVGGQEQTKDTVSKVGDILRASPSIAQDSTRYTPLNGKELVKADESELFAAVGYATRANGLTVIVDETYATIFWNQAANAGAGGSFLTALDLVFLEYFDGNVVAMASDTTGVYAATVDEDGTALDVTNVDADPIDGIVVGKGTDHERMLLWAAGANSPYYYSDHLRNIAAPDWTPTTFGAGKTLHAVSGSSRFNPDSDQLYAVLVGGEDGDDAQITVITFEDTTKAATNTTVVPVTATAHLRATAYVTGEAAANDFFVVAGDDGVLYTSSTNFAFSTFGVPTGYVTADFADYSFRHLAYHAARETLYAVVQDGDSNELIIAFTDMSDFSKYTIFSPNALPGTGIVQFKYLADVEKLAMSFTANAAGVTAREFALSSNGYAWETIFLNTLINGVGPFFARTFDVGGGNVRTQLYVGGTANADPLMAYVNITDYDPTTNFRLPLVEAEGVTSYLRYA